MQENTTTATLRLPTEMRQKLDAIAKREHRSTHAQIVIVLEQFIKSDTQKAVPNPYIVNVPSVWLAEPKAKKPMADYDAMLQDLQKADEDDA